ncbi:MAG TPA: LytR C-terminal domain-containing protein, partial [bacterium]|nr:LytR C-terminal domain-containing protein [bacterium]
DPAPAEAVASGVTDGTVLGDESTSEVSEETSQPQETTPPVLTAAAITITLLNGNGVSGVAGSIADRLSEAGFQVKTDNAENWEYGANEIFFTTENREKAEMVLAQYAYAGWIIHEEQYLGQETDILIILGSDYSEL